MGIVEKILNESISERIHSFEMTIDKSRAAGERAFYFVVGTIVVGVGSLGFLL